MTEQDQWDCGCITYNQMVGTERQFVHKPCTPARDCQVSRIVDEVAKEEGKPVRFVA